MFQAAIAVDDQQTVSDAVEHGLQASLAGDQGCHITGVELPQGFGHLAKTTGQNGQLGLLRNR